MTKFRLSSVALIIALLIIISCSSSAKKDIDLLPPGTQIVEMDKSKIKLDDGDTIEYDGISLRFLAVDTPEIAHPEHGFFEDQPFGRDAAAFTEQAINQAKDVAYVPFQQDRYGRTLAHIFVDGDLLGIRLIKAGLAYETVSHYGDNGFPELGKRILQAAKESQVKDFVAPHEWRREHRREPAVADTTH
jgi:micrococcal nuclease